MRSTFMPKVASNVTPRFLPLHRLIWPTLLVVLMLLAVYALARNIQKTYEPRGGIDLHPYWYYGHFVRAGINPYTAFAAGATLPEAVQYIDGSVVEADAVRQPRLAQVPANTAPLLLIITLFAYLPWQTAKTVWLVICVALVLVTPWLAFRLVPLSFQISTGMKWATALAFYAMKGPRVAIANGQPSILVFFLMILTLLLRKRYWLWAGLCLGIALSKYSIALPVAIFLLFERRFRILFVAFLVQVAGLLAVSILDGGGIVETLQVHWRMIAHYSGGTEGRINLSLFFNDQPLLLGVLIVAGTLITLTVVFRSWRRGWQGVDLLAVNSVLCLWILLATYHRVYDTMLALFFWILCLSAVTKWQLPPAQRQVITILWLISIAILCLPGEMVPPFFSEAQAYLFLSAIALSVTVVLVGMWALNLWLVGKTPRSDEIEQL